MRWLLITTIGRNPGDEWIRIGIQNVIRQVDPECEYILLDKESPSNRKTKVEFDKCIWCGMPVFWSQGENQNCRISWWKELMLDWVSDRKNDFMVLGAGSFFPWGRELETIGDRQRLIQSAEEILQRSFCVTARDEIVPRVTQRPIHPIVCPAIFSILDFKKSQDLKLANIMPNGAHYTSFGPQEASIWNEKKLRISEILRDNGFVFVAHSLAEFQYAQRLGWKKIIPYNGDPYGMLEYYGKCGKYFGNRVHGAIVARGNDAETWNVGYDSRQEAVRLSGARVSRPSELDINEIEDWARQDIKIDPFDMKSNFDKHVDIVRRCTLAGSQPLSDKLDINHGLNLREGFVNTIKKQGNVLLVRPDSIGDFVIFSGILEHFREIYKDSRIHILVQEHIAELAQNCPYIDEVITFDRKKLVHDQAYSDGIIEELKSRKFDTAIHSVYSRDETGDFLTLNSGADTKIASGGDESNMPPDKKLANDSAYTRLMPASDEPMLETARNLEFVSGLAGTDFGWVCIPEVWTNEEDETAVEKLLKDLNVEHPIVICPFSQWVIKDWPLWKWSKLISKYQDYPILFCGSQKDADNTNELIRTLNHNNAHNLCGRLTLRQLAALLKKSRLCLGVDTATIHIAAAVGCPQVVIVGGGHFGRFMPYSPLTSVVCLPLECFGCNWMCKYEKPYCTRDVAPVVIAEAVQQSFEKTKDMPRVFVQPASMWHPPTTGPKWAPFDRFLDISKVEIITVDGTLQTDERRSPAIGQNVRKAADRPDRDRYPKISIVTPSFNQKDYLEECICSILDQAYPNLEYIIMDGGSTDGSVEIIKKYAKYLTYWQSEPDDGQYAAINEGFKRTTGEIMTWLNSDDKFHPNAFRTVVSIFMHRKDVEWIMGCPNTFKEQGQQLWIARSLPLWSREKYLKKEYKFIQQEGTFWQRSLWEKSGATMQTDLEFAGDLELWARFFRFAQLHTIDALIAGYRYHPDQKAQVFMDKYIRESEKVLDREILLFEEAKNKDLLSAPEPILISEIREFLPYDANEINQQGEELLIKGELEGALDAFMKAIKIVPDSVVIHNNIGRLYLQKGESAKALKYFTKALKIDHHDQLTVLNCGQLLATHGKIEDTRKLYWSYLQRYPDDKEIANALANLPRAQPTELKKDRLVPSAVEGTVEVLDDKYLVSAVVSTYNSEMFLRGCLDDLEQQTIADKLQIIVVNSGSEENEETIVREFQQKYNNIVYIKTEQREGIYAAWNRAVNIAQGTFLTNANTDDRHRNDALEIMAKTLQENPDIALVYGDQICTDTPNGTFDSHHSKQIAKRPEYTRERLLLGCCVGSQPMWRKSLHSEIGFFDETLTCAGDWDFWLRISSKYKFKHIPDFLGLYYYNENGIEHGSKIHSLYERYIVGKRYGTPYISIIPSYNSKSNPLVSVIIPAYNAAEDIAAAIESVIIQNYRNFELVIINDGSTDNTEEIVAGFKDERIKYFRQENRGLAATHNAGIKQSQGEFVIKLDCDDMITPDFISRHLQEFEKHPEADLVYCNDYLIDKNSKPIRVIESPEYTDRKLLIRDLFRCGYPIVPFRTCIRKSVFDKIGFFDESLSVGEDYDMIRRFVQHGLKVHHLQDALYLRRMGFDSLSRNFNAGKAKSHFEVVQRFVETFRHDELFPDVDWKKIAPERIELHTKCLVASTYLAIGQTHKTAKSPPIYVKTAFEMACEQLNDCLKIDPDNRQIHELLQKCELGQETYDAQFQQAVSQG